MTSVEPTMSVGMAALTAANDRIARLETLLVEALDAFEDCTGDYADELTANEAWRTEATALREAAS